MALMIVDCNYVTNMCRNAKSERKSRRKSGERKTVLKCFSASCENDERRLKTLSCLPTLNEKFEKC
ncbi:CLUMA_CG015989, isoform A [Clunio marinus]|uniref:CLUMA_CG015989, isoform A n=1 Tax=Clunio marinus TaxID=568069 RepID=A0A1J1IT76_9DIPT|nr:CLUMA_CG015989, isoform A [Clunio marinus]